MEPKQSPKRQRRVISTEAERSKQYAIRYTKYVAPFYAKRTQTNPIPAYAQLAPQGLVATDYERENQAPALAGMVKGRKKLVFPGKIMKYRRAVSFVYCTINCVPPAAKNRNSTLLPSFSIVSNFDLFRIWPLSSIDTISGVFTCCSAKSSFTVKPSAKSNSLPFKVSFILYPQKSLSVQDRSWHFQNRIVANRTHSRQAIFSLKDYNTGIIGQELTNMIRVKYNSMRNGSYAMGFYTWRAYA